MSARLDTCVLLNGVMKWCGLINSANLTAAAHQKHNVVNVVVCNDIRRLRKTVATNYIAHTRTIESQLHSAMS